MGIEIEEMALLMSIPEVREATDAEKIDDINIRRLSSLMKKSDDVFLGGIHDLVESKTDSQLLNYLK